MRVLNKISLVGDALGTFPLLQQLNATYGGIEVMIWHEIQPLYSLIPEIKTTSVIGPKHDVELDLHAAFRTGLYMTQAYAQQVGLATPAYAPKAKLNVINNISARFDYLLAPFSRSLPPEQKWGMENWLELCRLMPDKKFGMFGSKVHDQMPADVPHNLTLIFGQDWNTVCSLMQNVREGVISVVTGLSHLAFHLDVKNYVLTNQGGPGTWGVHPDAISIQNKIPTLTTEELICFLQ